MLVTPENKTCHKLSIILGSRRWHILYSGNNDSRHFPLRAYNYDYHHQFTNGKYVHKYVIANYFAKVYSYATGKKLMSTQKTIKGLV